MTPSAASRDHHAAPAAVLAALWLGCMGPTRVSMLPPLDGSSPRSDPVRPLEQVMAAPQRDSSAVLTADDTGLAQGQITLAAVLVRIFAGATSPIMFGVFGVFDEERLFGTLGQLDDRKARPAAADRRPPRCAAFLCGPVTRPR